MKVSLTPAARADLRDIALYIAQENPTRALSFVDELREVILDGNLPQVLGTIEFVIENGHGFHAILGFQQAAAMPQVVCFNLV